MKGKKLCNHTWQEAEQFLNESSIVLIPIGGGTKEHGPHLPLGTDMFVVDELAERIVNRCDVLLLPTVNYAYYPAFINWPGSVSIEADHFRHFVEDIIRSIARFGVKKFLILDGGISTHHPMSILSYDLHNALGISVAVTDIAGLGKEAGLRVCEQEQGGHADESETSCLLSVRPDLVRMEKAVKEYRPHIPGVVSAEGVRKITLKGQMETKSGIHGDSTLANKEKGEIILKAMEDDLVAFIDGFQDGA